MYSDEYNNEEMSEEYSRENNQSNSGGKTKLLVVIAGIVLVVIIIIFLVSKNGNSTQQTPVTPNLFISSQKENLSINNNIMLSASVTNFQNAILTWASSNPDVATVDQNGLVQGVSYGTAIITATYLHTDNMPYSVSCEVTVAEGNPNIPITDVRFQEGEIMISVGSVYNLPVIIEPSDGYRTNVSYTSSNNQIVSVDNEGKIKANSVGKAIVSLDFNGKYKDDINVNVVQEAVFPQVFIPVTNIEFTDKLLKLKVGEIEQLKYQVTPQDALTSYLKWASSNESVATVSNGIVSALSPGTTNITLTSLDGVTSGIMTLEVVEAVVYATGITATPTIIDLKIGEVSRIVANVTPADATDKTVSYSSNNPSIASVDANGLVTAISEGNAVITLTATGIEEGANPVTTTIVVNVSKNSSSSGGGGSSIKVKEIIPSSQTLSVEVNKTANITATIKPSNATNKKISCISSDESILKVSSSGSTCTVKGIKEGTVTVTLKAKDGSNKEATTTVTVKNEDNPVVDESGDDDRICIEISDYQKTVIGLVESCEAKTQTDTSLSYVECSTNNRTGYYYKLTYGDSTYIQKPEVYSQNTMTPKQKCATKATDELGLSSGEYKCESLKKEGLYLKTVYERSCVKYSE